MNAEPAINDLWTWWQEALADPHAIGSKRLPVHSEPAGNGFFRVRRKGGPWEPVAIWKAGDGLQAMRGSDVLFDQSIIETLWSYACRNPVSEAAYDKAKATGAWDDEPDAQAEADSGDPYTELAVLFNAETDYAKTLLAKPIESQTEADKLAILARRISDIAGNADRLFEAEKAPIRKQAKAVDDKWRDLREGAKALVVSLKRHSDAWLAYLKRQELERQRKAQEEADAKRREAAEKMKAAEQANDPTGNAVLEAGKALADLKEAEREAEARKVQAGRTGARLSLKTFYSARIVDQDALYAAVRDSPGVVAALQQIADASARSAAHLVLPGCELITEERTV